mgnify:CR=1 FL=1
MRECPCCGIYCEEFHNHHILPKALGGIDKPSNIISICVKCHGILHGKNFISHSELTKAGLSKAKARGVKLGGHRVGHKKHHEAIKKIADNNAALVIDRIIEYRNQNKTYTEIADIFNKENIPTARNGLWYATTVRNYFMRLQK